MVDTFLLAAILVVLLAQLVSPFVLRYRLNRLSRIPARSTSPLVVETRHERSVTLLLTGPAGLEHEIQRHGTEAAPSSYDYAGKHYLRGSLSKPKDKHDAVEVWTYHRA